MRQGPSAKTIAKWEAASGESIDSKIASVCTTALEFLVANKVVASKEMVSQAFAEHIKSCFLSYILNQAVQHRSLTTEQFSAAAKKLAAAKALIDSIGPHEIEVYSRAAKLRRRANINIFSKSIQLSVDDAIADFKRRATTRPGPKERIDLEFSVEWAAKAFEVAAGREFKRNFRIHGPMNSPQSDFVTIDAIFVATVLKAVDPRITKSNVKTALLKLPPRRSGDRIA
jgi:hypothetical protein